VFSEILADSYLLNKFGIQNDMEVEISIAIRDFQEQFRSILGSELVLNCSILASGSVEAGAVPGLINTDELYAMISAQVGESSILDPLVFNVVTQPRPKNLLFRASTNYDYYDEELIGTLTGSFSDSSGLITGYASGSVPYYANYADNQKFENELRPQPEDFFRLKGYGIEEEWEITEVRNKNLLSTGYDPLFGRYVYNTTCKRRMPSHETVMSGDGDQEEALTTDKIEQIGWINEETSSIISGLPTSLIIDSDIYGI
jgi:hypothetical protein